MTDREFDEQRGGREIAMGQQRFEDGAVAAIPAFTLRGCCLIPNDNRINAAELSAGWDTAPYVKPSRIK